MTGETWTDEQKRMLRDIHICPVRNPPGKLKKMVDHFRKPGASVFAITEGNGPLNVSTHLARKVRDCEAKGSLDWMLDETTGRIDQRYDAEWRNWLLSHAAEFSLAVEAYMQKLARQVQSAEIHLGLRSGAMAPKISYGPLHRPYVESIFSRDLLLSDVRRKFESALGEGDVDAAGELRVRIGAALVSRIAI